MNLQALEPATQERLLALANELTAELAEVPVPLLADPRDLGSRGIPSSCMGSVVSFLARERDVARLRAFVDRLDRLDEMVAQNQKNPRAHYRALKAALAPWLDRHTDLDPVSWLYLLAWTRRLLPKPRGNGNGNGDGKTRQKHRHRASEAPRTVKPPAPERGGQLKKALERAMREKGRGKSGEP